MMIDYSGQQIGSYRLTRRLGFGGFASVYLGQHVRIATQQAAIKLLHLIDVDSQKFQQEAETTAALVHPHIIRLFDFDFHDQMPFLVMDYAPGGSLRSRHPWGTQVPLATVVEYVQEITKALEYAHSKHVIHRDIKPDNILIGGQGELRLSDFGIAVLSQTGRTSLAASHGVGGTAYYMAPEQSRGKPEKASDQYALAVMVYEWLCGKPPFTEGLPINIQYQHAYEPIPPLRVQLPTLPPTVEQVIMRALAKDPKERFATVQEFAIAFTEACTPHVSSPSVPSSSMLPAQKKPLGTLLATCTGHTNRIGRVVWSPDGRSVASASSDDTVRLWDAHSGQLVHTCTGHTNMVSDVAWSPDGSRVASASFDSTVRLWDAHSGQLLHICTGHTGSLYSDIGWSPDGSRVASASSDNTMLWDAHSGQLLHTYADHTRWVCRAAWSPDGRYVAFASGDKTVQLWDAHSGQVMHICTGHTNWVISMAWSPDGSRVASASYDKTVRLWDAHSGQLVHTCSHTDPVGGIAWSPNGKHVASETYRIVRLWDAHSGQVMHTCTGHTGSVYDIVWSPDGSRVASASEDQTVRLWDARSGQLVHTCAGHTSYVESVAWSPDGSLLASASNDKTVRLWQGI